MNGDKPNGKLHKKEAKSGALGLFGPYLTEGDCENMKRYKYKGGDDGLVYRYFYNPVATRMVEYLPDWLA